jgi:hypothetical protein
MALVSQLSSIGTIALELNGGCGGTDRGEVILATLH